MERKKLPKAIENYLSPKEKILASHSISQISRAFSPREPMYYATDKKIIRVIPIRKPEIDSVLYEDVISIEKVPGRMLKLSVIVGLFNLIGGSFFMTLWEKWERFHVQSGGLGLILYIVAFLLGIVFTSVGFAEKQRSCYQITAANKKKWLVRNVTLPTAQEFIRVIEEKTSRSRRTTKEKP